MATLRLEKDLLSYRDENIDFVQLQFPNEESLQLITVIISPQSGSPYQGCEVTFQLTFPDTYPMDPPKLKCLDRIYHPNINY
jgi:ubiquitin-conjugating enzyme E2 M